MCDRHTAFRTFDVEIINVTYIRSKLGFRRVLTWLIYVYTIGVGVFLISIAWKNPDFSVPMYAVAGMGISFFVMACYGFYWDHKNVPSFVADDEKLVLGRDKVYYWQDLEIVMINAKKWMGKTDYKAIRLTFRNNRPFYLFKYAYSNIKELEAFLADRFPQQLAD